MAQILELYKTKRNCTTISKVKCGVEHLPEKDRHHSDEAEATMYETLISLEVILSTLMQQVQFG